MIQVFRVFIPASILGLVLSEFTLIYLSYAICTLLITQFINAEFSTTVFFNNDGGALRLFTAVFCIIAGLYFQNLYSSVRVRSVTVLVQQVCVAIGVAFLIQSIFTYLKHPELAVPKWDMIFGSIVILIVVPSWRLIYSKAIVSALGANRVIFLGTSDVSQEIAQYAQDHPEIGMRTIGYVDNGEGCPGFAGSRLGTVTDLARLVLEHKPDLVVVGLAERRQELPVNDMLHMRFAGTHFEEAPVTFESTFGRVLTRQMRPSRLIFSAELGPHRRSLFWHSMYSFPIALIMAIVLLPVMLIVGILVKILSPGPILHRQVRVGLNDAPFTLYKFRSMRVDAEAVSGPVWAQKNDPRVTPLGKWLRKLRLDELPQLF